MLFAWCTQRKIHRILCNLMQFLSYLILSFLIISSYLITGTRLGSAPIASVRHLWPGGWRSDVLPTWDNKYTNARDHRTSRGVGYVSILHDDVIKWKHFPRYWPLWGEFTGHRWIPLTKAVARSFDVFFDLRRNKRLNKQLRRHWFETPLRQLWSHCNALWRHMSTWPSRSLSIIVHFMPTERYVSYVMRLMRGCGNCRVSL